MGRFPRVHASRSNTYGLKFSLIWRRRVEVESTTRSAKDRVAGFEGREGHRTPFAPIQEYHY